MMFGHVQDLQIALYSRLFAMLRDRCIKCFSEVDRWEHMLAVTIVDEAAGLANQAIDHIAIIE